VTTSNGERVLPFLSLSASRPAALLIALSLIAAFALPASAQTQEAPASGGQAPQAAADLQVFKDWFLRCGNTPQGDERCVLFQDLVDQNSQQPLMQIAVGLWGPEKLRGVIITVPLGVTLPPGLEIAIDEQAITRAPFFQCAQNGCQSRLPLNEELLAKMKAGQGGTVAFADGNGRVVPIPFSLQGFTAGYAAIR
jgi:invasion protein IalB